MSQLVIMMSESPKTWKQARSSHKTQSKTPTKRCDDLSKTLQNAWMCRWRHHPKQPSQPTQTIAHWQLRRWINGSPTYKYDSKQLCRREVDNDGGQRKRRWRSKRSFRQGTWHALSSNADENQDGQHHAWRTSCCQSSSVWCSNSAVMTSSLSHLHCPLSPSTPGSTDER